jgi:hypothetical protein
MIFCNENFIMHFCNFFIQWAVFNSVLTTRITQLWNPSKSSSFDDIMRNYKMLISRYFSFEFPHKKHSYKQMSPKNLNVAKISISNIYFFS